MIAIYDTTLRDGTQGVGVNFSVLDKLRISEHLDEFGISYIEGGWPGSNPKDVEYFKKARKLNLKKAKITAFGSTRRANVGVAKDSQVRLLLEAETPVVTIFGKSWDLHVTEVLKTTLDENLAMIRSTCQYLKKNGREVIYDAEHFFDGFKNNPEYALKSIQSAQEGGADIVVFCDTNGGTLPDEVAEICRKAKKNLQIPFGIHSHNDCELGVINAISAVNSGAVQIQGTINGVGERVGNCNLTSAMAILQLKMGKKVVPNIANLTDLSKFIDDLANLPHNPRAPFVGKYAFAHKGGIHVNAVEKVSRSYEHIEPEAVGNLQQIVVSELSGQSNILAKAKELGIDLPKGTPSTKEILANIKKLESEGYEFEAASASFKLLINKNLGTYKPFFNLKEYHCSYRRGHGRNGSYNNCEATIKVKVGDEISYTVASGDGPVNALDKALRKALIEFYPEIKKLSLIDYKVRIIDSKRATAAKTRVLIVSYDSKHRWGTVGVSDNIIHASWLALVDSFEYFLLSKEQSGKSG